MKKIIIFLFSVLFMFSGCANTSNIEVSSSSNSAVPENKLGSETEILEPTDDESLSDVDYDLNAIGGDDTSWVYSSSYTYIDGRLIRYVGDEEFQEWIGAGYNPNTNLQTFIQQFGLSKEEFLEITSEMPDYIALTTEEIDALFSGDQAEINRTFASPYAAVSEDGDIYTIFWLAEHDETDYIEAGLTAEEVGKVVETCADLGIVDTYVASVQTSLVALEENIAE